MNKMLIGIAASSEGAGKDTLFRLLNDYALLNPEAYLAFTNIKFSDELDKALSEHLDIPLGQYMGLRHNRETKDLPFACLRTSKVKPGRYRDWLEHNGRFKEYATIREHLLAFGTEFIRKYRNMPNHWADLGIHAALSLPRGISPVFTDVRFPNELEKIQTFGGQMIFIDTPWKPVIAGGIAEGHIKAEDCDFVVSNVGGDPSAMIDQLKAQGFFAFRSFDPVLH